MKPENRKAVMFRLSQRTSEQLTRLSKIYAMSANETMELAVATALQRLADYEAQRDKKEKALARKHEARRKQKLKEYAHKVMSEGINRRLEVRKVWDNDISRHPDLQPKDGAKV